MLVSEITLMEWLQQKFKLNEQDAKQFVREFVAGEEKLNNLIDKKFETKESSIRADISSLKSEIGFLRQEMNDHFATKQDVANAKADLIKWMFIFWITQLASLIAIVKFVLHQ